MIANISQSGIATYGIQEYAIDTPDDISSLPTDIPMGSTALIISTGEKYMLNGSKIWVKIGDSMGRCDTNFVEITEEEITDTIDALDTAKDLDFVKNVKVDEESVIKEDKITYLSDSGSSDISHEWEEF